MHERHYFVDVGSRAYSETNESRVTQLNRMRDWKKKYVHRTKVNWRLWATKQWWLSSEFRYYEFSMIHILLTVYWTPVLAQPINYRVTVFVRILCTAESKTTYTCANPENLSKLEASIEIIVVIWPTLWSTRARPDRRSDLRNIVPMICFEKNERTPNRSTTSGGKLTAVRTKSPFIWLPKYT